MSKMEFIVLVILLLGSTVGSFYISFNHGRVEKAREVRGAMIGVFVCIIAGVYVAVSIGT